MDKTRFRYNKKNLRYERMGFSFWRTGLTVLAYLAFGFLFFVGLNLLQNFFIETPLEKSLSKENKELKDYKAVLTSQLGDANTALKDLTTEEQQLQEKIFETPVESASVSITESAASVMATDNFSDAISLVENQLKIINTRSKNTNEFFSERVHIKKSDVGTLANIPSLAPVKNLTEENFVSGFGTRINPFHKGNYHHDGIDVALPKGTEVVATGNGKITALNNYSNLEGGFGNYIEIEHSNGIITRYSHLESTTVQWGQKIKKGQVIGYSGSSGGSIAPHLHYEVIKNGKNVNPLTYIIENVSPAQHYRLALKGKTQNQSLD